MKTFVGKPYSISNPLLVKISKKAFNIAKHKTFFAVKEHCFSFGHTGILTTNEGVPILYKEKPCITEIKPEFFSEMQEGDIVKIFPNGRIMKVWEANSYQNVIFMTERCNCKCIMCPQPCNPVQQHSFWEENKKILSMVNPETKSICFTGGEPTLEIEQLTDLLALCRKRFPDAQLAILTNGIRLADFEEVKRIVKQKNKFLLFCVSLHGDIDDVHDNLVGRKGAFGQVMRGLYNLARFKSSIEIRFVITKQNYERLPYFAEFVYRNIPFVSHVAFMGLEYTGDAEKNIDLIKVDPLEYASLLREAVIILHRRGMNVSIYNIPRCLLSRDVWRFSRDSISTWKKGFLDICYSCSERMNCCGLFETSAYISPNLSPIQVEQKE